MEIMPKRVTNLHFRLLHDPKLKDGKTSDRLVAHDATLTD